MMGPTAGGARPGDAPPARPGDAPEAAPEFLPGPPPETAPGILPEATADATPAITPDAADLPAGTRTEPWTEGPDRGPVPPFPTDELRARLASDPRKSMWIRRALASAAAGIIVSALADWRLGLTAAAVIAIADTIHRSRTTAAIPAAVRAPSAHRRTRRRLARLDRAGYRALHARAVPGSQCVIDHLVVGPGGVYSVDSERWDRRLPVRATKGGKLYHGPFCQADRLTHAIWAADEARRVVSAALGQQLMVKPAMVIYGPTIPWTVANVRGVDVFCGRRLRKYLQQAAKATSVARLDPDEIERIHAAAAHVLPPTR
ncbi:MAG TPA: NERD domain-containing protein [Streptosporangiaceae bacterium]